MPDEQNITSKTKNMEVPEHPRNVENKKKKSEYLLEFFMLFLAVFLGFLAENYREYLDDRAKEKQYIREVVEDLKEDTANFRVSHLLNAVSGQNIDSLIILLNHPERDKYGSRLYFLARNVSIAERSYIPVDRTFVELKNSGNLRLLTNSKAANKLTSYYYDLEILKRQSGAMNELMMEYFRQVSKVFDASIFQQMFLSKEARYSNDVYAVPQLHAPAGNPALANISPECITSLVGSAHYLAVRTESAGSLALNELKEAAALIELLQKEYHLGNE